MLLQGKNKEPKSQRVKQSSSLKKPDKNSVKAVTCFWCEVTHCRAWATTEAASTSPKPL